MLNILIASKARKAPGGLEHLPPHRLIFSDATPWGRAVNELLGDALAAGGDALLIDDDTQLTETSLEGVNTFYDHADAFGLDLHTLDGTRQPGARHTRNLIDWTHPGPAYVAHVSTSAIYLKRSALVSGARFPEWDGMHHEDLVYCFDLWLRGCKILAVPGYVHHNIVGGIGSTKRQDPTFWAGYARNRAAWLAWIEGRDLSAVPEGAVPVDSPVQAGVMV